MRRLHVFMPLIAGLLASAASNAATAERSENEKGAIVALKTIQTAQSQYYSQFGRYANSLRQLGGRDRSGKSTPEAAGLLDPELASGVKNGYRFALESRGTAAYAIGAAPTVFGTTGSRTYCSDQTGVVHEHQGRESATAQDPEVRQ
jgi:type IV pilus assembly protein PilA